MQLQLNKSMKERIIVYIDGFNLYFGMKDSGWRKYYWLDIYKLSEELLRLDQELVKVKYFTSSISNNSEKEKRQRTYLDALSQNKNIEIIYGQYKTGHPRCTKCGNINTYVTEKQTDVNISTEMIKDAYQNNFDAALLISGDSDLISPVKLIQEEIKHKRVIIVFPPKRVSVDLRKLTPTSFTIRAHKFRVSQLPKVLKKADGFELKRPKQWK